MAGIAGDGAANMGARGCALPGAADPVVAGNTPITSAAPAMFVVEPRIDAHPAALDLAVPAPLLVHLQVLPSRDRLPRQAVTHAPWHLTVPAGHDSQEASAVTSRWRERRPPSTVRRLRPGRRLRTPQSSLQSCPSPQQLLVPHLVVPLGQASTHSSFSQLCSVPQHVSPHFFSCAQATQNPPTHAKPALQMIGPQQVWSAARHRVPR